LQQTTIHFPPRLSHIDEYRILERSRVFGASEIEEMATAARLTIRSAELGKNNLGVPQRSDSSIAAAFLAGRGWINKNLSYLGLASVK
jgi:hypothetical protein